MTKPSDTQLILLSTAIQRKNLSILPLPDTVKPVGAARAIASLITRGFAEECETADSSIVHRTEGDIRYGVFATSAGLTAVGVEPVTGVTPVAALSDPEAKPVRTSKAYAVLGLLRRDDGATLAELIEATGWLPHTTRAALTSLRKKGHNVERSKRGEET